MNSFVNGTLTAGSKEETVALMHPQPTDQQGWEARMIAWPE